jgi:hypothetical protein
VFIIRGAVPFLFSLQIKEAHARVHISHHLGPVHPAYNPYFFFQPEQCFSLATNQPTVFFSWLISTANGVFSARLCTEINIIC